MKLFNRIVNAIDKIKRKFSTIIRQFSQHLTSNFIQNSLPFLSKPMKRIYTQSSKNSNNNRNSNFSVYFYFIFPCSGNVANSTTFSLTRAFFAFSVSSAPFFILYFTTHFFPSALFSFWNLRHYFNMFQGALAPPRIRHMSILNF